MRFVVLLSRVLALGLSMGLGTIAASAGTHWNAAPVPLSERVFFDRGAFSPEPHAATYQPGPDDPRIVPLPERRVTGDLLASNRGRGAAIVLAAVAPSKMGTLTDIGPQPLPWIVPAVPPLLSKAAASTPEQERIPVLDDLSMRAVESATAARPENGSERAGVLGRKRNRSEPGRLAVSKLRSSQPMSMPWKDPLAWLDDEDASAEAAAEFIMPFANGRVTSLFNQGRRHPAIDLAGALGSPVLATTARQVVIFAGARGGYGNAVITRDPLGRTHLYGHLQRVTSRVGQVLEQGERLGHLGSTGFSTGPHVHYEVKDAKDRFIDPATLLFPDRAISKGYAWLDVGPMAARRAVVTSAVRQPSPQ